MKARRASRVSRPLSTAASFFRKNGNTDKSDIPAAPPVRAPRPTTRVLDCQPDERELLRTSILPAIVNYLGENALHLEGLFVKDPSASSQEAMMGLTNSSQREPVRALRELLDARFSGDETGVFEAHDPYVWGISLKTGLKELSRGLVPSNLALTLIEAKDHDSVIGKADYLRRSFLLGCPQLVKDIFHLLHDCQTEKDKLGYMFSALLFLSVPTGQDEADFARLSASVEALSSTTQFMVANADIVFGPSPFPEAGSISHKPAPSFSKPPAPPPPPPISSRPPLQPVQLMSGYGDEDDADEGNDSQSATPPMTLAPSPSQRSNDAVLFRAVCIFDFDPDEPDELELRVGDVISVLHVGEDDWWRGRLQLPDGTVEEGVFPATYAKREDETPLQQPQQQQQFFASPPPPPPQPKLPVFKPEFQDEDALEEPLRTQFEAASISAFSSAPAPTSLSSPSGPAGNESVLAVALFDFEPEEAGELALTKGESFVILDRSDPDWWLGKRLRDGVKGLFPHNYAQLVENQKAPSAPSPSPPPKQSPTPPAPPPGPVSKSTLSTVSSSNTGAAVPRLQKSGSSSRPRPPPPPMPVPVLNVASTVPKPMPANPPTPVLRAPAPLPPSVTQSAAPPYLPPQQPMTVSYVSPPVLAPSPVTLPVTRPPPQVYQMPSLTPTITPDMDPVARGWVVTGEAFQKYCNFFDQQPKDMAGKVAGRDCAQFLVQSGLDKPAIAQILELSDLDGDKSFDRDEFCLATHLALCISKRGMPVPTSLPRFLVPSSKKHLVPM